MKWYLLGMTIGLLVCVVMLNRKIIRINDDRLLKEQALIKRIMKLERR